MREGTFSNKSNTLKYRDRELLAVSFRIVIGISASGFLTWQSLLVILKGGHYLSSFHVIYSYSDLLSQKASYFLCSIGIFTSFLGTQNRVFLEGEVFFLRENLKIYLNIENFYLEHLRVWCLSSSSVGEWLLPHYWWLYFFFLLDFTL